MSTTKNEVGAFPFRTDNAPPGAHPAAVQGVGCVGPGLATSDLELVATVQLYRHRRGGKYAVAVDHGAHGEWEDDFGTMDASFARAGQLVLDELRRRPTLPEMEPVPRILLPDVP